MNPTSAGTAATAAADHPDRSEPTSDEGAALLPGDLGEDLARAALALARRFHAGATLWVLSPQWEPHAHHVAVEFVHPVIVGKRALPAVAVAGPDGIGALRLGVRPGDVIVLIARADDPVGRDLASRVGAWGAELYWIGAGPRPPAGAADHVLWVDDDDPMVPATGRFVLLYHLLWELTHVCFEHPGLLAAPQAEDADEYCVTCSDEGRPGEVQVPPGEPFAPARVRTAQGLEEVDTTLLGPVEFGDLIIVHAGSAIGRIDLGAEHG